jgi:membrane-bound lytic murein transglycosylase MltF
MCAAEWVKNSTNAEMKKFNAYVKYFQKYAAEYNFDYLMLAAQGYQKSMQGELSGDAGFATIRLC